MHNDWMLDVLADLRAYSRVNGLPQLAEQLDDTLMIAADEIRRVPGQPSVEVGSVMRGGDANGVRDGQ